MKKCKPISFYMGISWPWQCAPEMSPQKSFQNLLRERSCYAQYRKKAKFITHANFWMVEIDRINDLLNRIRINETPLRPAIFTRASYT